MTDLTITQATVGRLDKYDNRDYAEVFRHLADKPSSERPYFLSWDYDALANRSVTDLTWQLGQFFHDQVTVYKPLCVNVRTGVAHTFAGERRCRGFNRSVEHFDGRCDYMQSVARVANGLRLSEKPKSPRWLAKNAEVIHWVKGLTVLQKLDKSCSNIAHFMGRILFLHHVLSNLETYSLPPRNPANIIVLAHRATMKRFTKPQQYNYYHFRLISAMLAPHNFSVAPMDTFLESDMEDRLPGSPPLVYLMNNLTMLNHDEDVVDARGRGDDMQPAPGEDDTVEVMDKRPGSDIRYACFKRVVIPSYLRGRFFIGDHEYPSAKASILSTVPSAPRVPRDSIRLRGRLNAWHDAMLGFKPRRKQLMLFDRTGGRRVFDIPGRRRFLSLLRRVGAERGYHVAVRDFAGVSFDKQYGEVRQVAVGIGIHGANLVNSVFLPPLSSLIEIFPHGFNHVMYRGGGNAGLKYFSHEMSKQDGHDYRDVGKYASVEECVFRDEECKKFYRDTTLVVTDEDIEGIRDKLEQAIEWSENLP